jgi:transglutaminase-like putative cysteine protease
MSKKILIYTLFILCINLLASCDYTELNLTKPPISLPNKITIENSPKSKDYPDHDGVILYEYEEHDLHFVSQKGRVEKYFTYHNVTKVFRCADHFLKKYTSFPENSDILLLYARVISPEGKTTILEKNDLFIKHGKRKSTDHKSEYKNVRFFLPSIKENSIIEYKYIVRFKKGAFLKKWWIQADIPKLESHLRVRFPKWMVERKKLGWKWDFKVYNYKNVKMAKPVKEFENSGDIIYNWTAKNIPAFESEPLSGDKTRNKGYIQLKISGYDNWEEMSHKFYKKMIKTKLKPNKIIKQKALDIVKGLKTEEEKIKAVFNFVKKFKYDNYHNAYGHGFIPNSPDVILKRGYGDCKDQAMLIIALLRSLDIKAYAALVRSGYDNNSDSEFVKDYFNHMIVYLITKDKQPVWLDPTFETCPYGVVTSSNSDRIALILSENGKNVFKRTPQINPKTDNYEKYKLFINIKSENSVLIKLEIQSIGQLAGYRKWYLLKNKEENNLEKYFKNLFIKDYFQGKKSINSKIQNIKYDDPKSESNVFNSSLEANLELLQSNSRDDIFNLDFFPLNHGYFNGISAITKLNWEKRKRKFDYIWDSKIMTRTDVEIKYPIDQFKVIHIPKTRNISLAEGELSFDADLKESRPGIIKGEFKFLRNNKKLEAKYSDQLKGFYQSLSQMLFDDIVFKKKEQIGVNQ